MSLEEKTPCTSGIYWLVTDSGIGLMLKMGELQKNEDIYLFAAVPHWPTESLAPK